MARAKTVAARITPKSTTDEIAFALQYGAAVGLTEYTVAKNPTLAKAAAKLGGYDKVPPLSAEAVASYREGAKKGFQTLMAKVAKKPAKKVTKAPAKKATKAPKAPKK